MTRKKLSPQARAAFAAKRRAKWHPKPAYSGRRADGTVDPAYSPSTMRIGPVRAYRTS